MAIGLLDAGLENTWEAKEVIAKALGMNDTVASAIDRLARQFSAEDAGPRQICPGELLTGIEEIASPRADELGVRLCVQADDGLPEFPGTRKELEQVLIGLVLNAMDAFGDPPPAASSIEVRARKDSEGQAVLFTVTDNGPGIDDELIPRIFEPFFTTTEGTLGLGLSIARRIVEAHGGSLTATRNSDRGMTFTVSLPLT